MKLFAEKTNIFDYEGGRMQCCCENCDDYLEIPYYAILPNKRIEITQSLPFICDKSEMGFFENVKDFEIPQNFIFEKHVAIIMNCESAQLDKQIQIISITKNGEQKTIPQIYFPNISDLPLQYFTVFNSQVIIYTKHFSIFAIKCSDYLENNSRTKRIDYDKIGEDLLKYCDKNRRVNLVADAYFKVSRNIFTTYIYIRDLKLEDKQSENASVNARKKLMEDLRKKGFKILFEKEPISNLPPIIRKENNFSCIMVLPLKKWKERFSSEVKFKLTLLAVLYVKLLNSTFYYV